MTITRARARAERVLQSYLDELLSDEDFLANTAEIEAQQVQSQSEPVAVASQAVAEKATLPAPGFAPEVAVSPAVAAAPTAKLAATEPQVELQAQTSQQTAQKPLFDTPVEVTLDSQLDQALHKATSNPELDIAFESAFADFGELAHESRQTLADLEPVSHELTTAVMDPVSATVMVEPVAEPEVAASIEASTKQVVIEKVAEPVSVEVPASGETESVSQQAADDSTEEAQQTLQGLPEKAWLEPEADASDEGFQCLVFRVQGMGLAVRLDALGGIHKQTGKPVKLPGQPDWYLGVYQSERGNIQVVDTRAWIMGETPSPEADADEEQQYLLLQIANTRWGLMCDAVDGTELIQTDQVRWREKRNTRPWLAGMLVNRMCALLDLEQLSQLLDQASNATGEGLVRELQQAQAGLN